MRIPTLQVDTLDFPHTEISFNAVRVSDAYLYMVFVIQPGAGIKLVPLPHCPHDCVISWEIGLCPILVQCFQYRTVEISQ